MLKGKKGPVEKKIQWQDHTLFTNLPPLQPVSRPPNDRAKKPPSAAVGDLARGATHAIGGRWESQNTTALLLLDEIYSMYTSLSLTHGASQSEVDANYITSNYC